MDNRDERSVHEFMRKISSLNPVFYSKDMRQEITRFLKYVAGCLIFALVVGIITGLIVGEIRQSVEQGVIYGFMAGGIDAALLLFIMSIVYFIFFKKIGPTRALVQFRIHAWVIFPLVALVSGAIVGMSIGLARKNYVSGLIYGGVLLGTNLLLFVILIYMFLSKRK